MELEWSPKIQANFEEIMSFSKNTIARSKLELKSYLDEKSKRHRA